MIRGVTTLLLVTLMFAAARESNAALLGNSGIAEKEKAGLKTIIVQIADRWVEGWLDSEWDDAKGIFKFTQGPYSDAFEHHYVAAVLINEPESKFYRDEKLIKRVVDELIYYSKVFVEQCSEGGLRGYWALNNASDKGVPVGSGSWQSRSFIRACLLLDKQMTPEQQSAWREGTKLLLDALTVDWRETFGPWWSTNKLADHVAAIAQWLLVTQDPKAKAFLDNQFEWFWSAFPEEGCADKYHNYFLKTMYRLAPILLVPEAERYHEPFIKRMKMWRSFMTPNGFYDMAGHAEPNSDGIWFSKLGPAIACLLLASPSDPELAVVAKHLVEQRLADYITDAFWRTKFDPYFDKHWGSLGLIIETAPIWERVSNRKDLPEYEQLRYFDYWRGLGRLAVKTDRYQASCYPHWAWTWDYATYGGVLFRLNTPGVFQINERSEAGRCWLDWDTHQDPERGGERSGIVVAISNNKKLSFPPFFSDEAIVTGSPEGRLYGFTHCRYTLGDALEVRTSNTFLSDAVIVLNTITALRDLTFDELYVQQPFANPDDLIAIADERAIEFEPANVKPSPSLVYPINGAFDLGSRGGNMMLAFVPLANSFVEQELVDVSLVSPPRGDVKRIPHRVEAWRGHLPTSIKKGDVFIADFAYVPHDVKTDLKTLAASLQVVSSEQGHGVVARGEIAVAIAAQLNSSKSRQITIADFNCAGQLFAAEVVEGKVRKVCLHGQSLTYRGKTVADLSRPAVLTVIPEEGKGIVDAGVGPIDAITPQRTYSVFSTDHDFPRMASISQTLEITNRREESNGLSEADSACRRFALLPECIEIAARLEEIEMLLKSAEARWAKASGKDDLVAGSKEALMTGNMEQARSLAAEVQKQVLALHEDADRKQKPILAVNSQKAAAVLLPPKVGGGQDFYENSYLISFAEEKARKALTQRAEMLTRSVTGRPDEAELCAAVRDTEQRLLKYYFGLPIHWTREHVPGQPEFFWRPFAGRATAGSDPYDMALLKYLHPNDQQWLAQRRIEAAVKLISE